MCGICGFAGFEDKKLLRNMCKSISHRGPDQHGTYSDKKVSLGHRRLSIIDLSERGRQPMCNENEDVWITFNGEVYNFQSVRNELEEKGHRFRSDTDTEVIIHAYEEYGDECLNLFNGDFAFSIYDSRKGKNLLFLARDRIGIKPLYYYFSKENGEFLFASEIKAILEHNIARKVNKKVLNKYISLRFNPGEETMFDGICKVLPGHFMKYDIKNNSLEKNEWWDVSIQQRRLSEKDAVKEFVSLFKKSVERRLISDVPLGAYLSGGIDSSSIVGLMKKIKEERGENDKIKTFSVGFGYGEETDELKHAKKISDFFGTDHKEYLVKSDLVKTLPKIVWHCDEPLADPALIPVYLLSRKAKKDVTVVLTGDGGDEVLAGYEQHKFMNHNIKKVPRFIRKSAGAFVLKKTPDKILDKFFKYSSALGDEGKNRAVKFLKSCSNEEEYFSIVSIYDKEERKKLLKEENFQNIENMYEPYDKEWNKGLQGGLYMELKTVLPENMLMKADKMTMAHAIEERVPFLDHNLVEFCFSLENNLKLRGKNEKYLLKKSMQNIVPRQIIKRKKQRFYVPIDLWIKEDMGYFVDTLLDKKEITGDGYFDYKYIEKIKKNYGRSRLYYARQLWNLINFQMWNKIYIKQESEHNLNKVE